MSKHVAPSGPTDPTPPAVTTPFDVDEGLEPDDPAAEDALGAEDDPDLAEPPPVVSTRAAGDYFSRLAVLPERLIAKRYDTQAQINADSKRKPNAHATADAAEQGMKITFVGGASGDASLPNQIRPKFPQAYYNGNLFVVHDAKWDKVYANDTYLAGLRQHKAFQLGCRRTGDQRGIEQRMQYYKAPAPHIALVDDRAYPSKNPDQDPLPGQLASFTVKPNVWTRRWGYVEFQSGTNVLYSEWIADATGGYAQLHNKSKVLLYGTGGLSEFWFELNSSQKRPLNAGPLTSWHRNFVVLRNVSNPQALVNDGKQVP